MIADDHCGSQPVKDQFSFGVRKSCLRPQKKTGDKRSVRRG
jgi:hypothetical protein